MKHLSRKTISLITFYFFISIITPLSLLSQEVLEELPEEEMETKLTPVFPEVEEGLIFIEGESAVSTNFAPTPVYNYGASGFKSLQLIKQNAPYGGQAYFSEYAFYVEEEGEYSFWYGGTPPAPQDTVYPSFASSFRYILDGEEPVSVYRENLAVVEAYTPSYYWMQVETIFLTEGVHRIRFEVPEKRRYDGQFYFFLDAFFFLKTDRMEDELYLAPPVFPQNRMDRSIDNPFQSISFYEAKIKEDPGKKSNYVVLSMIYSLLGDYINAIKNLNKAVSLDPDDPYPMLLTAKNRIWNGEVNEGLTMYRQLLAISPDNASYWAEAGKVAAWTGNYRESIEFFTQGLEIFPDNLNLQVNLGLTYLWMSQSEDADRMFKNAEESAFSDQKRAMELGEIHKVNGYPEYAANLYNKVLEKSPEYLETYLSLEESYRLMGEQEKAEEVVERIYNDFEQSRELSTYMNVYEEKKSMKDGILQDYIDALKEQPDNIALRQILSQTFFWNGMKEDAVDHSLRILINKLYISMKEFDVKAESLLIMLDRVSYLEIQMQKVQQALLISEKELRIARSNFEKAEAAVDKKPDDQELQKKVNDLSFIYAMAYAHSSQWYLRQTNLEEKRQSLIKEWEELLSEESNDESVFRQILGESEWEWNRYFTFSELRHIQRDEPFLASYILGRLSLFTSEYEDAALYLNTNILTEDPPSQYGLYQSYLWDLNAAKKESLWTEESAILTLYKQHLFDMEATGWSDDLDGSTIVPGQEESQQLLNDIRSKNKEFESLFDEMEEVISIMQDVLDRKLIRQMYYYEQDTYLLRYSLGDYYLEMGENFKAAKQFERVLAMDPWNISANYKLGIVLQRYGDWSRAMDQYKKVYHQNPRYENAAYYYNQLARQNADSVFITAQNITDTTRINYRGKAKYESSINTLLGWGLEYNLDMDRKYKVLAPGGVPAEDASQFKMHSLEFTLPFTFSSLNLTVTPMAGFYMGNSYFGEDWLDEDGSITTPGEVTSKMLFKPLTGISTNWKWNFLDTSFGYRYQLERESMFPDKDLTRSHFLNLNAATYFPLEKHYDLGPVISRTYGQFEFLGDSDSERNIKGQFLQEGSFGFVAARKPLIRLAVNGLFNLEDGSESELKDLSYYLPSGVMELKGGLRGTVNFHNADYSENLELSLYGAVGGYWTGVLDSSETIHNSLKAEGLFGLYYVKQTMTLFINVGGSSTFRNAKDLNFWEFYTTLGARVNVPSLLSN